MTIDAEQKRLDDDRSGLADWRKWGPYLSERQWGTVREDYSADGSAWDHFTHEQSRSRAYRWGEDGIAGISDNEQRLCFAVAMWNGKDPILKERLFGLTGPEGNHGEDVKELYYYLDATPSHSYLKMLYKYPQAEFPYNRLVEENRYRGKSNPEFELLDTGIFDDDRYFDVFVEYAKAGPEDILVEITAHNRGPKDATIHLLPQAWFRNTWSWNPEAKKPQMRAIDDSAVEITHDQLGRYVFSADGPSALLFTENETNGKRLWNAPASASGHYKDAFHEYVVHGEHGAVNAERTGTKAAAHFILELPAGQSQRVRLRLARNLAPSPGTPGEGRGEGDLGKPSTARSDDHPESHPHPNPLPEYRERGPEQNASPFADFDSVFDRCRHEADVFYSDVQTGIDNDDARLVQRQVWAGMIWSKQFFYYDIGQWLGGDPAGPTPPPQRKTGRNSEWMHLNNADIISMPDKWEYPWYAAWDLAFHCIPLAMIDPEFAKRQLILLTRESYMHPNGQLPAYEWAFSDVNPPVHAWSALRVYQIDKDRRSGIGDVAFLERVFHKLLLNFTWWVNRKDAQGRNIFQGGFLGLDNIGVFDRSAHLPTGGFLSQCDGTGWMAMYSLNLMRIAIELSTTNPTYQDLAAKFFQHFMFIAAAMTNIGGQGLNLWDDTDEFYYDVLCLPNGASVPLKLRSMVGLIPLFAVEVLDSQTLAMVPEFKKQLECFLNYRPDLAKLVSRWADMGSGETRLLSLLRGHRMKKLLKRLLDETEFLSPFGVRALSKSYKEQPYIFESDGHQFGVRYCPAESDTGLFGGNSNWRGPIWMPVNFLLVESIRKFHAYYGDDFKIECPTNSGNMMTLRQIADELATRLTRLFLRDETGKRPVFNHYGKFQTDPNFRDYVLFYEYFHGDTGRGVGASHQTGWTGLIAALIHPREDAVSCPVMMPKAENTTAQPVGAR